MAPFGIILDAEAVIVRWSRSTPMTTFPESHRDLLKADVAMLATIGQDGYPQLTALWFLFDEDATLKLSLNSTRQKVKNLQAHAECTFFILDTANPYRTLKMRAQTAACFPVLNLGTPGGVLIARRC